MVESEDPELTTLPHPGHSNVTQLLTEKHLREQPEGEQKVFSTTETIKKEPQQNEQTGRRCRIVKTHVPRSESRKCHTCRRPPQGARGPSPTLGSPSPGVTRGDEPPQRLALKTSKACVWESQRAAGNRLLLKGNHEISHTPSPSAEARV